MKALKKSEPQLLATEGVEDFIYFGDSNYRPEKANVRSSE